MDEFGQFLGEGRGYAELLAAVSEFAKGRPKLAPPTSLLDSGQQGGVAFNTTDPNVIIRVSPADKGNEDVLSDEDIQATGGVAKTYFLSGFEFGGAEMAIAWKEKVSPFVEALLLRMPDRVAADEIVSVLVGLYHIDREGMKILLKYPVTRPLARAIQAGLPVNDLDLSMNLGVNSRGEIVAYDC